MTTILFDLDNTLYKEANTGLLAALDERIESYLREKFGLTGAAARERRYDLYLRYGTTLTGLMAEEHTEPAEYLAYIHDIDIPGLVQPDVKLEQMLASLGQRLVVFTNAERSYAESVIRLLSIEDHIERIFSIEDVDYRVKPDSHAFRHTLSELSVSGADCFMVDDNIRNLETANQFGIVTALVHAEDELSHFSPDFRLNSIYDATEAISSLS